jgi:cbb3-type cytochrome oxidase cytochrome c subunit
MSLALRTTMIGTTVGMLLLAARATVAAKQEAATGQAVYEIDAMVAYLQSLK